MVKSLPRTRGQGHDKNILIITSGNKIIMIKTKNWNEFRGELRWGVRGLMTDFFFLVDVEEQQQHSIMMVIISRFANNFRLKMESLQTHKLLAV